MPRYHLLLQTGQWRLLEEGRVVPIMSFRTKREGEVFSLCFVADRGGSMTIHKPDGSLQEEHSYPGAAPVMSAAA